MDQKTMPNYRDMNRFTLAFSGFIEESFQKQYAEKNRSQLKVIFLLLSILFLLWGVIDPFFTPDTYMYSWINRLVIVLIMLLCWRVTFSSLYFRFRNLLLMTGALASGMLNAVAIYINPAWTQVAILAAMAVILATHTLLTMRFVYATMTSFLLIVMFAYFLLFGQMDVVDYTTALGMLMTANIIGMFSSYSIEQFARRDFVLSHALEEERQRSESLLLNILPSQIAKRLKNGEQTIADDYSDVTVLFADIVNFTEYSKRVSPTTLVQSLNLIFTELDSIVDYHRLEKIKTIGDAYMLVSGLPKPRTDHVEAVANAALDMQIRFNELSFRDGTKPMLRIGIHTGPVVAGVIGVKKFSYDVWGDTINMASRMEAYGVPSEIQVSSTTYKRLKNDFILDKRGMIEVKGYGETSVYLLKAKRLK